MRYGPGSSRERPDDARRPSRAAAIEGFGRGTRPALRAHRKDGEEVAVALLGGGRADGTKGKTELRSVRSKAYLFVVVDRTSKLVFAKIYREATNLVAAGFLKV